VSTLADANAGPGHRRLGMARAERLKAAAAESIAVPELDDEMAFEVGMLLDRCDLLEQQIGSAETHVAGLLDGELARRLQTIPGVGPAITAVLIAEIGDIWRFDDFDQLLAYAGVHPAERSSGRKGANPETSWHMSKAGNAHLRAAAYRLAVVGVTHSPVIRAHYERKRTVGKSKMNALGHRSRCVARYVCSRLGADEAEAIGVVPHRPGDRLGDDSFEEDEVARRQLWRPEREIIGTRQPVTGDTAVGDPLGFALVHDRVGERNASGWIVRGADHLDGIGTGVPDREWEDEEKADDASEDT
jgi:hypothetical protein